MTSTIERGRLKEPPASEVTEIMVAPSLSQEEVQRSFQSYLDVNKAHVIMLAKQGIIARPIAVKILAVTKEMAEMGNTPTFEMNPALEEMYFNLEDYLIKRVGIAVGGQQHTARSRNDLHATVDRMVTRRSLLTLCTLINKLRCTLLSVARDNTDAILSGYTHLQPSEPITFAHYLSAVLSALERDYHRLERAWQSTNLNPLGGGSMGSTTWPIDRKLTTELLGFDGLIQNSLDCVCSRDYLLEIMSAMSIMANTLARVSTDMRIWATPDFGYVEVADRVAVCSSIMPQKKNPWTFESITSFCARIKGYSDAAWMTYKGVPYAFTMESMDLISNFWPCLKDMTGVVRLMNVSMQGINIHKQWALEKAATNFCTVTELANTLVRVDNMSFRAAHEIVAHAVGYLTVTHQKADAIDVKQLNCISQELFNRPLEITQQQIEAALDPVQNVQAKTVIGGTAPQEVQRQLLQIETNLETDQQEVARRLKSLDKAKSNLENQFEEFL